MLTKEEYNNLPEKAKNAFVLDDDQYVPVKDAKLKSTLDDLDGKCKTAEQRAKELEQRLASFEEAKKAELAAEREKALADAKKANNIDEILRIEREQAEDGKRRAIDEAKGQWQREMSEKEAAQRAASLAKEIALIIAVDEASAELIELSIRSRINSDVDLKKDIFSDRSGSALSVDKSGFAELLAKEPQFARLVKANISTAGTGGANGNSVGSATKKPEEYTEQERVNLYRTNPTLFNQLFPKRA